MTPGAMAGGEINEVKRELVKRGIPLASQMTAGDQTCFLFDIEMQRQVQETMRKLEEEKRASALNALRDDLRNELELFDAPYQFNDRRDTVASAAALRSPPLIPQIPLIPQRPAVPHVRKPISQRDPVWFDLTA